MTAESPLKPRGREIVWVFVVALVLRVAAIFVLHAPEKVADGPWEFGFEAACIAQSVHDGNGFAAQWQRPEPPWREPSSATGWLAPGYPALVALAMQLTGGLTESAALFVLCVQSLLSALTCVFLWKLGLEMRVERAGRLAAWILALLPVAIWNSASVVWDTTIVAFGIVVVLWAAFALRSRGLFTHAVCGVGFGALLLVNPAPLVLTPLLAWIAWHERKSGATFLLKSAAFATTAFLVVLPWLLRNEREVGVFALRTNLGVELDVGNNDEANGRFQLTRHPSNSAADFMRYRDIGEAAYTHESMERATAWISAHKLRFAELTLLRGTFFWFGVNPVADTRVDNSGRVARSDLKSWIKYLAFIATGVFGLLGAIVWGLRHFEGRVFLGVFALFPLVYYATHALERYRFPIEPLLVLSLAWLVCELRARSSGAVRYPGRA
ncbi:MAG: hypothetical protein SGI72_17325 [Planctomycetota bacterium]|nr:hypothetical protein [Planctomycetota bacterium]